MEKYLDEEELEELEADLFQADLSYEIIDSIISNFKNKIFDENSTIEKEFISAIKNTITCR